MTYYSVRCRTSVTTYRMSARSLAALLTTLLLVLESLPLWRSRMGHVVRSWLGLGRRYGVRCAAGSTEKTGFLYRAEAEGWGRAYYGANFVTFYYEPVDLRILPSEYDGRAHFTGASGAH